MDKDLEMAIKMGPKSFAGIERLFQGKDCDEREIIKLCDYVDERYDCADFRMITLLRTFISFKAQLSQETINRMKKTILGFKYWMDEPGEDSMCYWSENHQILFFSSAYVAGRHLEGAVFTNSGLTGTARGSRFRERIINWLRHRFNYGFIEWHSNTYYEEDIAPLALLVDFADEDIRVKAAIVLDLFALDMAAHNFKGLFSVTSGRCYADQKRLPFKQDTLGLMAYFFGDRYGFGRDYTSLSAGVFISKGYQLPEVIRQIGNDSKPRIIKTQMGHDLRELKAFEAQLGSETTGYIQWAMEAFSNPEVIKRTMKMYRDYGMKHNDFLKTFELLNYRLMDYALPVISKILNPVTDGVAIQKVNSYTYMTENYCLSTAQKYYPGTFGDQQHIWQATIDEKTAIFTTHPGAAFFDDNARNFSPDYWVGNGILPHSVQHENVNLSIYDLRRRKGFLEKDRLLFTHAHFPTDQFDQVVHDHEYIFAEKGKVKIALIGGSELLRSGSDPNEWIQKGKLTYWVFEISDDEASLEAFIQRIKNKKIAFEKGTLSYGNLRTAYNGELEVDGKGIGTHYKRMESPYCNVNKKDQVITVKYQGCSLILDFENNRREAMS